MKVQLVLAGSYTSCVKTRQIWQQACEKYHVDLQILDLEQKAGQTLAQQLNLKTFPALVIEGEVKAVGHPDEHSATALIANLVTR